jgi:hypothetical protein
MGFFGQVVYNVPVPLVFYVFQIVANVVRQLQLGYVVIFTGFERTQCSWRMIGKNIPAINFDLIFVLFFTAEIEK